MTGFFLSLQPRRLMFHPSKLARRMPGEAPCQEAGLHPLLQINSDDSEY